MVAHERRLSDRAYLDENLWIPKGVVNVEGTKRALTFIYTEGQGRREKELRLYKETKNHIQVPREFWDPKMWGFEVVDTRPQFFKKTGVKSRVKLDHHVMNGHLVPTGKSVQKESVEALLKARGGILQLACGKGKTVIALHTMAQLGIPCLIVVDNTQLLMQWKDEIARHLDVPGGVGLIQADVCDWQHDIVLSTYQTLASLEEKLSAPQFERVRKHFGAAFYDEAHHVNAPTFSRSADFCYGRRYGLTATPKRDDGLHVIHEFHFGSVVYRDLSQDLKAEIYFHWTGLAPDISQPGVVEAIHASNGELNIGRLAAYFGGWQKRLDLIVGHLKKRLAEGRKILVLSVSVDELINLLATWNGQGPLYSDIPLPTKRDVGETIDPVRQSSEVIERLSTRLERVKSELRTATGSNASELKALKQKIENDLKAHEVAVRIDRLYSQKQAAYREQLLSMPSDAGLMIHKVPASQRMAMLRNKAVTFAIMKYGKEGLDDAAIDTVVCSTPMSSKAVLQQVMGRSTRHKQGKKQPVLDVFEDNVGPLIGMCRKMRSHLRHWPVDEGGPFTYTMVGHPGSTRKTL